MRKCLSYGLTVVLLAVLMTAGATAQVKLDRWVFGSGGMVNATSSTGTTLSGVVGQVAIDKISGTFSNGQQGNLYEGFWVPTDFVSWVDPTPVVANDGLSNFPNPVSVQTTIKYELPGTANVTLKVYDMMGHLVKTLVDGIQDQGPQAVDWDLRNGAGSPITSGAYLYELSVNAAQVVGTSSFQNYVLRNVMVVVK